MVTMPNLVEVASSRAGPSLLSCAPCQESNRSSKTRRLRANLWDMEVNGSIGWMPHMIMMTPVSYPWLIFDVDRNTHQSTHAVLFILPRRWLCDASRKRSSNEQHLNCTSRRKTPLRFINPRFLHSPRIKAAKENSLLRETPLPVSMLSHVLIGRQLMARANWKAQPVAMPQCPSWARVARSRLFMQAMVH